jgi:hypothetical protein
MIKDNKNVKPYYFSSCASYYFYFNLFTGTNCVGVVDYGLQESTDQLATQALVFMVVALNDTFKLPIAHFFTTGISAQGTTRCSISLLFPLGKQSTSIHYFTENPNFNTSISVSTNKIF